MITKDFREKYKDQGYHFRADKRFTPDKRANLIIREESSGKRAEFSILHAFGEMDVVGWTDMTDFNPKFKEVAINTLEHIAKTREVKVMLFSLHSIFNKSEVSKWKDMKGYNEFSQLFKNVNLNEEASVKIIDELALYDRIELNRVIVSALENNTSLKDKYKMNNHISDIQVWWTNENNHFKEIRIRSQQGFHIENDFGKNNLFFESKAELQKYLRDLK